MPIPDPNLPALQVQQEETPEPVTSSEGLTNEEILQLADNVSLTQAFDLFNVLLIFLFFHILGRAVRRRI